MLMLLSPAKTLDFSPVERALPVSRPGFPRDTATLAKLARRLKSADLKRLMGISDKLATLNVQRFRDFKSGAEVDGAPAALAFAGDVYTGLRARELDADALAWAQDRVRILSGLYGLLRPLDLIQPYRLEMGIKLANPRGEDLYAFWREKVTKAVDKEVRAHADRTVVNLASLEYFGAVDRKALKARLVTCQFKEGDGEAAKIVSFFAKTARGLMVRFAIDARAERADDLKAFAEQGYRFAPGLSDAATWTFTRPKR
jgi:cytoplasmic iron level regulating protein YaaA (DUF328/UPF0246 family)